MDAAVATAYALAVTHPSAGNVGGGGFMLVAMRGEPTVAVDFRERAPLATNIAHFNAMLAGGAMGPAASAVPGSVAGLNLAEQRWGRLGLAAVLTPAIELARDGHDVGARSAAALASSWPVLRRDRHARRIFGRRGRPLRFGDRLVQRDLARTLERIARTGDAGFYTGPTARAIVRAMGESGRIRLRDLREYRAVTREPLRFDYRGYDFATAPPPSSGGLAVAQVLQALERLRAHELAPGSIDEHHLFVEVSKRARAQRRLELLDPDDPDAPSSETLMTRLSAGALLALSPELDPTRATPTLALIHSALDGAEAEVEHTTHLSVVDAEGNAVSLTTTLSGGFGARYVVPGAGIVMNNALAGFGGTGTNRPKPGRRIPSSMAPTLVADESGVVAVLGSPGGDTIPSTVVQVARHLIDHAYTIDRAVEAPRVHHRFIPDEVRLETERPLDTSVLEGLGARGHLLRPHDHALGAANAIVIVRGVAYGHADFREGGLASGLANAPIRVVRATDPPAP